MSERSVYIFLVGVTVAQSPPNKNFCSIKYLPSMPRERPDSMEVRSKRRVLRVSWLPRALE